MSDTELSRFRCPLCNGEIGEAEKFFFCKDYKYRKKKCDYKIWKKMFNIDLSAKQLRELLAHGKTQDEVYGFIDRTTNEVVSHKLYYNKRLNQVRFLYDDNYNPLADKLEESVVEEEFVTN